MREPVSPGFRLAAGLFAVLLMGLFVHSLAPTWNDGTSYYSHGWVVAGAAVALLLMRWREASLVGAHLGTSVSSYRTGSALAVLTSCVVMIFVARMVWTVDVNWRLPLWVQSLATVMALAILIGSLSGRRVCLALVPVLLLLLLCVPWPSLVEHAFVNFMTESVVDLSVFFLRATGTPVEANGNALLVAGQQLMVAEGCSGLRSFQGSLAGALLIAEYFQIRIRWRASLVVCSLLAAFLLNGLRVLVLAKIADGGLEITSVLHDRAGNIALVVLFGLIFVAAVFIERRSPIGQARAHRTGETGKAEQLPMAG